MLSRSGGATVAVIALVALAAGGCRDDTVAIRFAPNVGSTYRYEAQVRSTSVTTLGNRAPVTLTDSADLVAVHRVLAAEDGEVQVSVEVSRPGAGIRTFVMRFDRAAQLTAVESVEGIPADALGDLGVSEIFPAGTGAPPDRRLAPGDTWRIESQVIVPGAGRASRLVGTGRLVELRVEDGRDLATIDATFTLPVTSAEAIASGTRTLTGRQESSLLVTYDLADGAVERATSTTTGTYTLELVPDDVAAGAPIEGTVTVEVRAVTHRLRGGG